MNHPNSMMFSSFTLYNMKAALLRSPKKIEINDVAAPQVGAGQVSIQPALAGVCGSDVSVFAGHRAPPSYPLLLGHEFLGWTARHRRAELSVRDLFVLPQWTRQHLPEQS